MLRSDIQYGDTYTFSRECAPTQEQASGDRQPPYGNMTLSKNLLHRSPEEKKKYKGKVSGAEPHSYVIDVKCAGCYKITTHTVFSHAQQ